MIKERAINFKAHEVTAIIEGKKTQLRRVLDCDHPVVTGFVPNGDGGWWKGTAKSEAVIQQYISTFPFGVKCPYGVVGDRLWVRESWSTHACFDAEMPSLLETHSIHYWADGKCQTGKKRSSAHMPRKYSRILLEITNIRVERLNQISRVDAVKEGLHQLPVTGRYVINKGDQYFGGASSNPCEVFQWLWEGINGTNSWSVNPWVWVVEFKIIQSDTAP